MYLKKLLSTTSNFKKTAYHHYGHSPLSLLKFMYYSGIRINTFIVYENDLTKELCEHNLETDFRVVKPTMEELKKIRSGMDLSREFYYDRIYNAKTCYLAFKDDKVAYIHWVFFKGDYSRFLILRDGIAELNYNTTMPEFRGIWLSAKMMAYISKIKPKSKTRGARVILRKLKISGLNTLGSSLFPPDIRMNPTMIIAIPIAISL